jgi:hypothetical protein
MARNLSFFFQVGQQRANPLAANSGAGTLDIRKAKFAGLIANGMKNDFSFCTLWLLGLADTLPGFGNILLSMHANAAQNWAASLVFNSSTGQQ